MPLFDCGCLPLHLSLGFSVEGMHRCAPPILSHHSLVYITLQTIIMRIISISWNSYNHINKCMMLSAEWRLVSCCGCQTPLGACGDSCSDSHFPHGIPCTQTFFSLWGLEGACEKDDTLAAVQPMVQEWTLFRAYGYMSVPDYYVPTYRLPACICGQRCIVKVC